MTPRTARSRGTGSHVLILGAGLVSRPIIRYFLEDPDCRLTVASLAVEDAEVLIDLHPRGTARSVDVTDPRQLEPLIQESDLVISLVPYAYHARVARCAIRHGVDMVTASYLVPKMRALDAEARAAGVTILNEVGLDPGIDHMSAMRMIDRITASGGRVIEFKSCCGGLPSPEAANNPWRYKFSWSPRGALLAGKLSARYLDRGRVVNIPGDVLFAHTWPYEVEDLGQFEIYANRDSLRYIDAYGLHDVETMLRATIRYPGWCETMKAVADLGLLDVDSRLWDSGMTYADFLGRFLPDDGTPLKQRLAQRLGIAPSHPIVQRLEWVGLLSDEPLPERESSPLGVLADRFHDSMAYGDGERDMVVLRHEVVARWPHRAPERWISLLVACGDPDGDSATARTVSLPAAVAGRLLLDGQGSPGMLIPTRAEVYEPILARLEQLGIAFREWNEPAAARR